MASLSHDSRLAVEQSAAETTFRKILVPLDGTALAEQALLPAFQLARRFGGDVGLLCVEPYLHLLPLVRPADALDPRGVNVRKSPSELAQRYLDALRADLGERGVPVWDRAVIDDPASAILDCIEKESIGLVVMTSHNRSGLSRWWMGSVADQLLTRTDCPVLILPEGAVSNYRKLLVPLDGSEVAESALPVAETLAGSEGQLLLLRAPSIGEPARVSLSFLNEAYREQYRRGEKARSEAYLDERKRRIEARGYRVATRHCPGRAAEAILRTAADEKVDAIVMTTHGRGGWDRLAHGSVAYKVRVTLGWTPLLLVPRRGP
ncbi:MAG: universal stress protein [Armatimonadetes bacterium]|nr:universal stress protein [Armatimonadota bacterium]